MRRIIKALSAAALAAVIGIGVPELPVVGDIGVGLVKDVGAEEITDASDLYTAVQSAYDGDTITLYQDIGLTTSFNTIKLNTNKRIILNLNGHTIKGVPNYPVISVSDGLLELNSGTVSGVSAGVKLEGTGRVNASGVEITNCTTGIIVGSECTLNFGENSSIVGCATGVDNNGSFTMNSGSISYGGIAVYTHAGPGSASFTMTGGTIQNNNVTETTKAPVICETVFNMTGGEISGNTSPNGAVYVINAGAEFTMSGGQISGNTSENNGQVFVSKGKFVMNEGSVISGGTTPTSGVYISSSIPAEFEMNGGTITENSATNGGGVYNQGTFTMTGGTISENTALYNGGGVFNAGTFTMTGGEMTDNTAYSNGGGVYFAESAGMNVSGTPIIRGNKLTSDNPSNVYVGKYGGEVHKITITGSLEDDADIHVTPYFAIPSPKDNYKSKYQIAENGGSLSASDNFSDNFYIDGALAYTKAAKGKSGKYFQVIKYTIEYDWEDIDKCTVKINDIDITNDIEDKHLGNGNLSGKYGVIILSNKYEPIGFQHTVDEVDDGKKTVTLSYSVKLSDEELKHEDAHICEIGFEIYYDSNNIKKSKICKSGIAEYELTIGYDSGFNIRVTPYYIVKLSEDDENPIRHSENEQVI